ncbi:MAG: carbohydrate binding family 9 domain-containing protein [candidate division WOR-3 bacterium]|nr:carbohydrate binding family 9 domain-containing protein [candidate division WOR-3 bacterium]
MIFLLLLTLITSIDKRIEIRFTETAPRIDGHIEDVWYQADSITDFIQSYPDEASEPTERSVVYVLQDNNNLYVAFRCYAVKHPPVAQLYGMEEEVTLHIDPMDSKSMGYFFKVYASGLYHDGLILDNGANWDWSWSGVWYNAVSLEHDRFEIEMMIPFKSIRYKKEAKEWGINFERIIAHNRENDHWIEIKEKEGGFQVSKFGKLIGIIPKAHGYYFELYPEGFLRLDQNPEEKAKVKPRASMNFKWDMTRQTTINATVLPDFAQIEADPTQFNLSRYELWLSEQRPFFLEGSEIFRMRGIGEGPFEPLNIFYSRRIGKAIGQEPIPILSGLKLTSRSKTWSFGALSAYTDRLTDTASIILEPRRGFAVLSGKKQFSTITDLGVLFAGTMANPDTYNYAIGTDFGLCSGPHRSAIQAAFSDQNGKLGWALNSGYSGMIGDLATYGLVRVISDSFSVQDIGFVPWAGQKLIQGGSGPYYIWRGKAVRSFMLIPGFVLNQEPGSKDFSYTATVYSNIDFRNNWGTDLDAGIGKTFEADTSFLGRYLHLSFWGSGLKYNFGLGGNYNYGFNYRQGFLASNYSDWFNFTYYYATRVALMLNVNNWWEYDPDGKLIWVTSILRPKIDFRISARLSFNVYDELVFVTPETKFGKTELATNRIGFLFSWNFKPKSWLFIAFNDYSVDETLFEEDGNKLSLINRVGAIKVRYLLYF